MSFIDKINRRAASWAHRHRPKVAVEDDDLVLTQPGERITLRISDLSSAVLSFRDIYSAYAVVLTLGFDDKRHVEIFQDDPCWFDLMAALDRSSRIAVPSREWQLRFLAAGAGAPPLDLLALHQSP